MARLTRITQKIFGSGAGVNQIAKFGSLFAGSPAFTTDPAQAQSLSNWLTGWFAAAIGGNAPAIEDMNAVHFAIAYQLAYLCQAGIPEWDSGTTYFTHQITAVDGAIYVSLQDDNTNHLVTDAAWWKKIGGEVMSALGDIIYGGAAGSMTRLAGNTSAVLQVLTQTGDGLGSSAAPAWRDFKAPTVQTFTSNGTYTPSAGVMYIRVKAVGGGGGGSGGGSTAGNGTAGGSTTFGGGGLIQCTGGSSSGQGGIGASGGQGTFDPLKCAGKGIRGAPGGATNQSNSGTGGGSGGGTGGSSSFGGGGGGGWATNPANAAAANSGAGGGGGGGSNATANGQGGSAGGEVDVIIANPLAIAGTFAVVIGAGGTGGAAGGTGGDGGAGAAGQLIVEEYYQ